MTIVATGTQCLENNLKQYYFILKEKTSNWVVYAYLIMTAKKLKTLIHSRPVNSVKVNHNFKFFKKSYTT